MKVFYTVLSKDKQTRLIQINAFLIMLSRAVGIGCNLYIIPITLNYLDKSNYGVWLTLTSIISWLSFMDIGLGNGMRNKIAQLIEENRTDLLKQYISSTYSVFSIIVIAFFVVFAIVNLFIPWTAILRTNMPSHTILLLTYVVVFSFCVRLVLDLAPMILVALQKPYVKAFIDFLFNAVTLLVIYCLAFLPYKSLALYGTVISLVPVVILVAYTFFLFNSRSKYHYLAPSLKQFRKEHVKSLFGLGIQFFIIQLAALIVFSTDNILITQFFSSADVTIFNIVYKYFSVITIGFMIVLTPYWSSFTSAYYSKRIQWIKDTFKRLLMIWAATVLIILGFVFFAPWAYRFWLGKPIEINSLTNLAMGLFVAINGWNNLFVYFLNGISKIRLQLYSSLFICIINIPLSYFLAKFTSIGLSSIIFSNCACLLICSVWAPIQCYKIINGTDSGIWSK